MNIQIMVTTGGTSLRDDIMRLYQPVHLLVGTPGRVLDLANKGVCNLRECSMLVMDEVRAIPLAQALVQSSLFPFMVVKPVLCLLTIDQLVHESQMAIELSCTYL